MAHVRTMRADELAHACEIVAGRGLCEREEGLAVRPGPIAAASTSDFLVAESGGELVGVLLSTFDGFSRLVSYMAVAPGHERRGIGRLLLKAAAQAARTAGCGRLELVVPADTPSLHEFCRATGFAEDGFRFVRSLRKGG